MTARAAKAQTEGSKIAMTAPVGLSGDDGGWTVQFTMPSEYSLEDLPQPNNKRVHLKSLPPATMAVLKFSGLTGEDRIGQKTARLRALLLAHNLTPTGEPSLARYDPPWTPWFMRLNELMVPILGA